MGCGGSKDADESANKSRTNNTQKKSVNGSHSKGSTKVANGKGTASTTNNSNNRRTNNNNTGRQPRTKRNKVDRQPIIEKGYKKRIREQLRQATDGKDIEELENAIAAFEKNKLEDNGDLEDAKEKLSYLMLKKEIRDAILRRHPGVLDKAIQNVEESPYQSNLQHYLDRARDLRRHLAELDQYKHDILEMDQATISEIRSYHHPPEGVHETMTSTYLILGYDENKLAEWADVQCMLGRYGKESLMREITNADTVNMEDKTVSRVQELQSKFTSDKIRVVSCGAATFYVWNNNMCDKFSKDSAAPNESPAPTTPASTKGRKKNKG